MVHQLVLREDGHENDSGLGILPQDKPRRGNAGRVWHSNGSDDHIGANRVGGFDQRTAVPDDGADHELRLLDVAQQFGVHLREAQDQFYQEAPCLYPVTAHGQM